jgi:hypothetical protein
VKSTTRHSQEQHHTSNSVEERFLTGTSVHHFKKWLSSHDHPQDTDFFRRFLADSQITEHASRGFYEAKMRSASTYSAEDLEYMPLIQV